MYNIYVCLDFLSRRGGTTPTLERPITRFHYIEMSNYNIRTARLHDHGRRSTSCPTI